MRKNKRYQPIQNFGYKESPPDYRDIYTSQVQKPVEIPEAYEIDVSLMPIWNQKKLGACVGHATAKLKQAMELSETKKIIPLSARFIYALCKHQDNISGEGTYPRLAMQVLQNNGCCTETLLLNDTTLTNEQYIDINAITIKMKDEAKRYKIKSYASVFPLTFDNLKQAIYQSGQSGNGGVLLCVSLDESWWTDVNGNITWSQTKILPIRTPKKIISGHAIWCYGYNKDSIKFMNSWSKDWADKGKGYFNKNYEPFFKEGWTGIDLSDDWIEHLKQFPKELHHCFGTNLWYRCELLGKNFKEEVKNLQIALLLDGEFTKEAFTPEQLGYFGKITLQAVKDFQKKYNIKPAWGFVGVITRGKLSELFK